MSRQFAVGALNKLVEIKSGTESLTNARGGRLQEDAHYLNVLQILRKDITAWLNDIYWICKKLT